MQNARQMEDYPGKTGGFFRRPGLRSAVVIAPSCAVLGCSTANLTPERWENPSRPEAAWSRDRVECLAYADRLAGVLLESRSVAQRPVSQTPSGGSIRQIFAVEQAKEHRAELFAACMSASGYRKRTDG